jgi:hypothetical protein
MQPQQMPISDVPDLQLKAHWYDCSKQIEALQQTMRTIDNEIALRAARPVQAQPRVKQEATSNDRMREHSGDL